MPDETPEVAAPEVAAPEVVTPEAVAPDAPVEGTPEPKDAEGTPEPSPKEIELSEKFNQITAREKDLRDAEERIKTERESFGQTASELEETRKILADFKNDPLAGLKALGIEFKDVAERVINDGAPTAEHRVAKLEREWADQRQAEQDAAAETATSKKESDEKLQAEEKDRAVAQTRKEIETAIEEGGDKFEMIRAQGAEELVFDVAAKVFRDTQKILTWTEAAEKVEEQIVAEVEKYLETPKFKAKYQLIPEKSEISVEDKEHEDSNFYARKMLNEKYGRILNNQMSSESSSSSATSEPPTRWLDDEESKDFLAKKLKAMLEA